MPDTPGSPIMSWIARARTMTAAVVATALWPPVTTRAQATARWAVCYSDQAAADELARYDLVVLDPDRHPPLASLRDRGRTVLAYLSLTQMDRTRAAFPALLEADVILHRHAVWTGAHYIDFRHPEWSRLVLDDLVPRALAAGFTGLFLDTLDDAGFLEEQDASRYAGMREAAIRLVRAIRHRFPGIVLMVNRGYALLPDIAREIDILLGESVVTTYDAARDTYVRLPEADVAWQVERLRRGPVLNPRLQVFTLDYWDPADADGLRRVYREQRSNGFVPYVSTPALDRLIDEPR